MGFSATFDKIIEFINNFAKSDNKLAKFNLKSKFC